MLKKPAIDGHDKMRLINGASRKLSSKAHRIKLEKRVKLSQPSKHNKKTGGAMKKKIIVEAVNGMMTSMIKRKLKIYALSRGLFCRRLNNSRGAINAMIMYNGINKIEIGIIEIE